MKHILMLALGAIFAVGIQAKADSGSTELTQLRENTTTLVQYALLLEVAALKPLNLCLRVGAIQEKTEEIVRNASGPVSEILDRGAIVRFETTANAAHEIAGMLASFCNESFNANYYSSSGNDPYAKFSGTVKTLITVATNLNQRAYAANISRK